ncbi:MAG TPA: VWA domain-containing protein [Actinocrinis sp.]|nr:VWA domain-containing protein [Actinocrinis sp.]
MTTSTPTSTPTPTPTPTPESAPGEAEFQAGSPQEHRRQVLYWRLLSRLFGSEEQPSLETASLAVVDDLGLPSALLDPGVSVDTIVQRFPALEPEFKGLMKTETEPGRGESANPDQPQPATAAEDSDPVRRAALVSKLLLNVFAAPPAAVSATHLACWQQDSAWLQAALGPDGAADLGKVLAEMEGDLVRRMNLREVLADPRLAARLTPSMSLIEQLLRDKHNLSGVALKNAKALIRRYIDEVAQVLRTQVQQTSAGTLDRSVPPKRVYRNLDLDRTIWKNLTNWSPEDQILYVDKLFYRHTAKRTVPARMIVVVDQSGSMVDSMVNCTILASILAGLPKVDVHLVAYDTRAIDLSPWVHDPFEVLLRTKLGGGTDGTTALALAQPKVADPRNTVVVWISDFYESHCQQLYESLEAIHRSGAKFIPVGSVTSSGHQIVNPWFRERFKNLGTPVISGKIQKLVRELKTFLD